MKPRISVIMGVYNDERFLKEAKTLVDSAPGPIKEGFWRSLVRISSSSSLMTAVLTGARRLLTRTPRRISAYAPFISGTLV